ncbi:hypothetical protein Tco_1399804 [Tanacetum coccineum]
MLKVSPWKGVIHFGKKGKSAPRYVEPFEIFERIGPVAYRLRLLEELSRVHDTFHVSNLKKCLADASLHVPLGEIKVSNLFVFVQEPVEIMDRKVKSLKRSKIVLVKVRWNSKRGPEFTWEREDYMKSKYPQLFVDRADESATIPDEYLLKFHNVPDAKSLWAAIKSRFGGNEESKKMQKNVLKHQFENFVTASNETLDKAYDRFQKLISQLEIHGAYVSKEDINQMFLNKYSPSCSI